MAVSLRYVRDLLSQEPGDENIPLTAEVGGEDGGGVQEQRGGEGELHCADDGWKYSLSAVCHFKHDSDEYITNIASGTTERTNTACGPRSQQCTECCLNSDLNPG